MPTPDKSAPDKRAEAKEARVERLSAALRENLKRRKARIRAKERKEARSPTKD
jgi:hypothetical protein